MPADKGEAHNTCMEWDCEGSLGTPSCFQVYTTMASYCMLDMVDMSDRESVT